MKKIPLLVIGLTVFLVACSASSDTTAPLNTTKKEEATSWEDAQLTDVITNDSFRISSFDNPVLIEAFAVWCPTCTRQQQEIKRLHEDGANITSISVNVDPNEDAGTVRRHAMREGFNWRYAVLPREVTDSFVNEFGTTFVNPPLSPVVLRCPDGRTTMLSRGVKPASELADTVTATCGA